MKEKEKRVQRRVDRESRAVCRTRPRMSGRKGLGRLSSGAAWGRQAGSRPWTLTPVRGAPPLLTVQTAQKPAGGGQEGVGAGNCADDRVPGQACWAGPFRAGAECRGLIEETV